MLNVACAVIFYQAKLLPVDHMGDNQVPLGDNQDGIKSYSSQEYYLQGRHRNCVE